MLPTTLGELLRRIILTGPLLSQLVCDKFQHLPVQLGDEAVITSVGYPLTPYDPVTKCMTSFYPTTAETRVQVDCADLETDGSWTDYFSRLFVGGSDYLLLANGLTWTEIRSPFAGPVRRVGAPGQVVRVGFFTDGFGRARGFSCSVRGVRAETPLTCGVRQLPLIDRRRQARILGGTTQGENEWPWLVQVFATLPGVGQAVCSGTLISPRDVLTSAHCLPDDGSAVRVVTGALRIGSGVPLASTDYTRHPGFNDLIRDVGVVRLPFPQTYSAAVRPVCLPCANAAYPQRATAAGWGQQEEGGQPSQLLRAVTMLLLDQQECDDDAIPDNLEGANLLCTQPARHGATPCPSDSGGPLMTETTANDAGGEMTSVFTQVGITSLGEGCTAESAVALFTRVSSFLMWIQANTDWEVADCV